MNVCGISVNIENIPTLDSNFIPFAAYINAFRKSAKTYGEKIAIAIMQKNGQSYVYDTIIHGTPEYLPADQLYIERLVKFLLWMKGGNRIVICGNKQIGRFIRNEYCNHGRRHFDATFMESVFEDPFEVIVSNYENKPNTQEQRITIAKNLSGCRIGFDAGGSDRKVAAVDNGNVVFSEEVVWHPKLHNNPDYHYRGIVSALKKASSYLPRVDAVGISSAGIYIRNRCMVASLFLRVPQDIFDKKVKDIYIKAIQEIGDISVTVCNDGDVAALAGAMELKENNVLGIAMGTSEAAGYVDANGQITGWLNELAFAPVDLYTAGALDEWSLDIGCGVKYFSQDAIIRLAEQIGVAFENNASPAEKLKTVQSLLKSDNLNAKSIFETIGTYLGHTLPLYYHMYQMKNVLLLGRVTSGLGGDIILKKAVHVLNKEYSDIAAKISLTLPDESSRRVGQAIAAACLPNIK